VIRSSVIVTLTYSTTQTKPAVSVIGHFNEQSHSWTWTSSVEINSYTTKHRHDGVF